ncbi:Arp complex subunit [Hypoxylon texense]
MRLLNVYTRRLEEFTGDLCDRPRPEYAKIRGCCEQAIRDGYDYVWVDTCCIDKGSSAELSEAINSMFAWYRDADICYVYLVDVPTGEDPFEKDSAFRKSRWHTRR